MAIAVLVAAPLVPCTISQTSDTRRVPDLPLPRRADGDNGSYVNFSFDKVDVTAFVKLVGEMTGLKFVVSDDVRGQVTVVSPRVAREDVYSLFVSILESAKCSIVREGDLYRVVPLPETETRLAPVIGADEEMPAQGLVTKVFRLVYVRASEVRKLLESNVGGGKSGGIGAIDETNHLIVTDTADNVRRVEKIVAEIDRGGLSRVMEVVTLQFAGADELAQQINLAMSESESRADRLKRRLPDVSGRTATSPSDAYVVASPHANRLILVGTPIQLGDLKRVIAQMDVDAPSGRGHLNAVFLKYISAEEAAKSIGELLKTDPADKASGSQKRRIAIQASAANNALLIDAGPGDFDVVKRLIDQIDVKPQQVHISVLITEHAMSDETRLGFEMAAVDLPSYVGDTVIQGGSLFTGGAESLLNSVQQGLFPRGITVGLAHGTRVDNEGRIVSSYPAVINIDALKRDGRFKVLSETSLEAQNNMEASINIVNEIPILKSTVQGSGGDRDFIQNIERIEVGIKLTLTPQIIPGGEVRMQLNPSIEAVVGSSSGGSDLTPTIARRDVKTTVTVPDNQTIIIAGLTREDKRTTEQRVPFLGSIPLLGWLFRHEVDQIEKTNLLIFVTPRIISSASVADDVKREWETKTNLTSEDDAP